jgi:2-polyprenyl-6-methoxyphenol hydroxylase-like FAD-dependent oxidoreductase
VLERHASLDPLGAGISLWPNAVRVLVDIGVARHLPTYTPLAPESGLRRWDGRLLAQADPRQIERRYGQPLLLLQRQTLHAALLTDGIAGLVETGTEVKGVSESGDGVRVELQGGAAIDVDLVIGADGLRSTVRAGLLGDGAPRHSGLRAYRAIVPMPQRELGQGEYWGAGSVFGLVPVDEERLYWFATRRGARGESPEANPIPALLERHRGWAPEIVATLEATPPEAVLVHDLLDRKPTSRWRGERIALLGDAAHPMLPFLGQGACQALEDAQALGEALRTSPDVPAALRTYEERRRQRAARLTTLSRRMGKLAHLRGAPLRALRDRAMAAAPESLRMRQLDLIVDGAR